MNIKSFDQPIYVTKPFLPKLEDVTEKLQQIWDAAWLTNNGEQHQLLENELKNYLKVPYLSLFNNGTIALITACRALELTGEVITTPFTFAATPHVLTWNNLIPVFCDINPVTMNIDPAKIEAYITPKTSAILAVHVFGTPCEVDKIQRVADHHGLKVIYDAAHAFGVEKNNTGIGNFGDVSMYSFHATKLYHTAEGGALAVNDSELKAKIDLLKNFGIKNEDEVIFPGINGKMNEIQAALGLVNLKYVAEEVSNRKMIKAIYQQYLAELPGISFVQEQPSATSSYQYCVIRINEKLFGKSRDHVYHALKRYNVFARKYFYPLCSNYACYQHLPSAKADLLPVANQVAQEVLSLPFYGTLSEQEVVLICKIIQYIREN